MRSPARGPLNIRFPHRNLTIAQATDHLRHLHCHIHLLMDCLGADRSQLPQHQYILYPRMGILPSLLLTFIRLLVVMAAQAYILLRKTCRQILKPKVKQTSMWMTLMKRGGDLCLMPNEDERESTPNVLSSGDGAICGGFTLTHYHLMENAITASSHVSYRGSAHFFSPSLCSRVPAFVLHHGRSTG
jgi:hypothetical protein